jgi:hypothetical protein
MAIEVHLSFTGEVEKFVQEMAHLNIQPADLIGRALWLLMMTHRTERVVLLRDDIMNDHSRQEQLAGVVQHVFRVVAPELTAGQWPSIH